MAKSLKQVMEQIEKLQREAEELRRQEVSGVIARIQEAISHYALTPEDLFGSKTKTKRASPSARGRASRTKRPAKYTSEDGRTWSGIGKRPTWFNEALASGKTPEDLLVSSRGADESSQASHAGRSGGGRRPLARKAPAKKSAGEPKYHDGSGKTWTGRGKRPAWFVQALDAGKSAEDMLIPR